jgi:hypothetical protein
MKKMMMLFGIFLFSLTFISAEACNPVVSLINQDPYPAIPGEYVKLVFQVNDISNSECKNFVFELLEKYPLVFDPNTDHKVTLDTGFYERDYGSFLIAPYKVRVDSAALKGDNPLEVGYKYGANSEYELEKFNIYIEDSRADFEIHIDKYSYATKEMTVEILNIADTDIEALTIEIPKQDNIIVQGTNRVVVGDLDSNEYTTADFKANLEDGELTLKVLYTDQTGIRREVIEKVFFDSDYFSGTEESGKTSFGFYFFVIVVIGLAVWWYMKKQKIKKQRVHQRRGTARLG